MTTQTLTRMDEKTMDDAVDRISSLPGVETGTVNNPWATFNTGDSLQGAIDAALKCRGVVVHKVDRSEGFLSIALEDYADEL